MVDFLIIGGGIIGLLTAKELRKSGASVALVEKGCVGQQATWAAGGILSPMRPWHYSEAVNAISSSSQLVYPQLAKDLYEQTGIDSEWVLSGMLVLNDDDMTQALQWCEQQAVCHDILSVEQLNSQFPYLKEFSEPALLRADVATIRPHKLLAALRRYLLDEGLKFYNEEAQQLMLRGDDITGVQLGGEVLTASEYVICGGAWSASLIPEGVVKPDISPVKGQMVCFPPTDIPNACMVMDGDRYIIPRKDGRIVVGSTREHTGFDASTTRQAFESLRDFAQQLYPVLSGVEPDAHWAGLRPSSPDSIPYICRVEPYKNLSLNAGHYRNGIVTAPASAQLMTDIVLGRPSKINAEPYRLER
ncbi:MAG: glycine oxidase [Cycloclasticus sp. symbiont of Poecilosclerida sp. M]|nr:MAG: glycine oxidase [Cycloclasticus sp. symbiont of Poecilosclerida sp. M]